MSSHKEKRRYPRAPLCWSALIRDTSGARVAEIENLSASGAFIRSHKPYRPKERFKLHIMSPGQSPVSTSAEVSWLHVSCSQKGTLPCGMGVRFLRISKKDRSHISQAVDEHNA